MSNSKRNLSLSPRAEDTRKAQPVIVVNFELSEIKDLKLQIVKRIMKTNDLFEERSMVAVKLKGYIRERGFTKASIARKAGIPRTVLDRVLGGSADNEREFDDCVSKALAALSISADDLIRFEPMVKPKTVNTICLKSVPKDYQMSAKAQKQYGLLMDILELCEIYY